MPLIFSVRLQRRDFSRPAAFARAARRGAAQRGGTDAVYEN